MRSRSDKLMLAMGGGIVVVFIILLSSMFVPKCYIASFAVKRDGLVYRTRVACPTKSAAHDELLKLRGARIAGTEILDMDVQVEGRSWFCQ